MTNRLFQDAIYTYYREHGRVLPWRETFDPYHILVSEIMLQQTQVERVKGKYNPFLSLFPDFLALSQAPLRRILQVWQGLGYNRRAIALQKTAQIVVDTFQGTLPSSVEILETFPGIGHATASAICAFAFQKPVAFIETNIRRVYIFFFFQEQETITDAQILHLVEKTLDRSNPRKWYYALMDYGAMLKKEQQNPNRKSAHYQKQAPFMNSDRRIRGMIIKALLAEEEFSLDDLINYLQLDPKRVKSNLLQLEKEGFIQNEEGKLTIL